MDYEEPSNATGKRKRKRPDKYNTGHDIRAHSDSTNSNQSLQNVSNGVGRGRGTKGRPKGRGKAGLVSIRGRGEKYWPKAGAGVGYSLASVLASVRQIAKGIQLGSVKSFRSHLTVSFSYSPLDSQQHSELHCASTSENVQHLSIIKMGT